MKDENGKAIRMIGAIQDVTKQKELKENNQSKNFYSSFHQSNDHYTFHENRTAAKMQTLQSSSELNMQLVYLPF